MSQSTQIDLASAAFKANPYPSFARLRAGDPLHLLNSSEEQSTWLITRYAEAEQMLRDERFVKDRQHVNSSEKLPHIASAPPSLVDLMDMSLVDLDPPDHTRLRALVNPFFAPRQIEVWRTRAQEVVDELIDAVETRGQMDLIEEFAALLPLRIILEILGVPAEDGPQLHEWTRVVADSLGDPLASQQIGGVLQGFYAYLLALVENKRKMPDDALVSTLVRAETESGQISAREIVTMTFLLITAGHDTADNLIGNGMLALLTHPEQMLLLKTHPELLKPAIEELLRYQSPFMLATMRWAREDVKLGNTLIRRGDSVLISPASANRDKEAFNAADELNIARQENPHLAFGKGIHYCLGAPLARLEGQVAISSLLHRLPNLRLQSDPATLEWRPGSLLQGLRHLPVAF